MLYFFVALASLTFALPLFRHEHWIYRAFEFPRWQKFVLFSLLLLALLWYRTPGLTWWACTIAVTIMTLMLARMIHPFTRWGTKQVPDFPKTFARGHSLRLLIWNVWQDNHAWAPFFTHLERLQPDVVLLAETHPAWADRVSHLRERYPHGAEYLSDNTYGMLLLSRYPLESTQVAFLIEEGVPSLHAVLRLPQGTGIRLHCVHPKPPSPTENTHATERDGELLLVAKTASQETAPVIVMGDLNDVAWSYTTTLFQKMSGLLDPRRGRGFFNTFHARIPFMRVPLDHIFCSRDFNVVRMERLPACGSDHFPMFIELMLVRSEALKPDEHESAQPHEVAIAEDKIERAIEVSTAENPGKLDR